MVYATNSIGMAPPAITERIIVNSTHKGKDAGLTSSGSPFRFLRSIVESWSNDKTRERKQEDCSKLQAANKDGSSGASMIYQKSFRIA